jgi:hypothetical protein
MNGLKLTLPAGLPDDRTGGKMVERDGDDSARDLRNRPAVRSAAGENEEIRAERHSAGKGSK